MKVQYLVVNKHGSVLVDDKYEIISSSNPQAQLDFVYSKFIKKFRSMFYGPIGYPDRIMISPTFYQDYKAEKYFQAQEEKKQNMLKKAKPLKYHLKSSKERKKAAQTKWPNGYLK